MDESALNWTHELAIILELARDAVHADGVLAGQIVG